MDELEAAGLMREPGRGAFAARDATVEPYATKDWPDVLPEPWDTRLRAHPEAAAFWDATPPSYRRQAVFHITDAKRETTQEKRFGLLLAACAAGERLP